MSGNGLHHLGLATHDMEATLEFYEKTLDFEVRVCDLMHPQAGGSIRHAFIDVGDGAMIAFMECNDVPGIAPDFDTGINRGLGIKGGVMHFAFKALDEADLDAKRAELSRRGVAVSDVVDHGWCKSIYFSDPNRVQLEYCVVTQPFGAEHVADRDTKEWRALAR